MTYHKLYDDNFEHRYKSGQFTERCILRSILRRFYRDCRVLVMAATRGPCRRKLRGQLRPAPIDGLRIVQNADSTSRFDRLDAALHSGSLKKRGVTRRQAADFFPGETDRPLNSAGNSRCVRPRRFAVGCFCPCLGSHVDGWRHHE